MCLFAFTFLFLLFFSSSASSLLFVREEQSRLEVELKHAQLETKQTKQQLERQEKHYASVATQHKEQVSSLMSKLGSMSSSADANVTAQFSSVLREEMKMMQKSYEKKIERIQDEAQYAEKNLKQQIR